MKSRLHYAQAAILASFFLQLIVSGCNAPADSHSNFDIQAAKAEIVKINNDFVATLNRGDSVAAAEFYTIDAKFLIPNAPATSTRANILSEQAGFINAGLQLQVKTIDVWGTADLLTEEGEYTVTLKDGTQADTGKYLVLWKKDAGQWKIFRDIINSNLPLPK